VQVAVVVAAAAAVREHRQVPGVLEHHERQRRGHGEPVDRHVFAAERDLVGRRPGVVVFDVPVADHLLGHAEVVVQA
jgi:hypothetical protein